MNQYSNWIFYVHRIAFLCVCLSLLRLIQFSIGVNYHSHPELTDEIQVKPFTLFTPSNTTRICMLMEKGRKKSLTSLVLRSQVYCLCRSNMFSSLGEREREREPSDLLNVQKINARIYIERACRFGCWLGYCHCDIPHVKLVTI